MMSTYLYDEWGSLLSGKVHTNGFYSDNYLYNGEAMDITTELYYLRARYYDPSQGRFLQQDTFLGYIETPISQNLYIYCYNSPLNYIDPSGNETVDLFAVPEGTPETGDYVEINPIYYNDTWVRYKIATTGYKVPNEGATIGSPAEAQNIRYLCI